MLTCMNWTYILDIQLLGNLVCNLSKLNYFNEYLIWNSNFDMNSKNGNEFNFDLYFVLGSVSHFTSLMLVDFQSTPKNRHSVKLTRFMCEWPIGSDYFTSFDKNALTICTCM